MRQARITYSILALAVLSLLTCFAILSRTIPHFNHLKSTYASRDRAILDRNGQLVDLIDGHQKLHRFNWIEFDQLPAFLQKALVADTVDFSAQITNSNSYWANKLLRWTWSKAELAEAYINLSIYRRELEGLSAASFGLYDKAPADLSPGEAAVILALAEHEDSSAVTEAACDWLNRMDAGYECGLLSQDHLMQLENSYRIGPFVRLAPHFTQQFAGEAQLTRGNVVHSTLDRELQLNEIQALQKHGLPHAAVVVIENATGHLLAYVDTESDAGDVAEHVANSALQPLLYAQALEERVITAGTLLLSAPQVAKRRDRVTVRTALDKQLTLPSLATLQFLGADHFAQALTALGLEGFDRSEELGPSLALGHIDVRLLQLTNAYRALANGGTWTAMRISPDKLSETGARKIFSEETAFIAGDLLSDGKGYSVFANENWSLGFSSRFTVGIWSSQAGGAAQVWQETMAYLHRHDPSLAAPPPPSLVRAAAVDPKGHFHGEWFIEGTEPGSADSIKAVSHISYPQDLSTIELDKKENLLIKVIAPRSDQNLYLNGERLGRAKNYQAWQAHSGKFTLELRDSHGHSVDRVRFEVRGRSFALSR